MDVTDNGSDIAVNRTQASWPVYDEPTSVIYTSMKSTAFYLTKYFLPVITIAGTIGNVLSVVVFLRTKLKKLSSSYYLAFLAIFDTGFLWCSFLQWLNFFQINVYKRNILCQLFTWISNACSVLSVWLVVAFTIERFVAVLYPLKRQSLCTVQRARSIIFYLVLFNAINSSPLLLFASGGKPSFNQYTNNEEILCTFKDRYETLVKYYNYYDSFVGFVIPMTLIITLNTVTALAVWKPTKFGRTVKNSNSKELIGLFKSQVPPRSTFGTTQITGTFF